MHQPEAKDAFRSYAEKVDGHKIRARSESFTDYFSQATLFWNPMADWEKDHIAAAFSFELNNCETKSVPPAVMANLLVNIHPELAARVADKVGLDIEECKRVTPKSLATEIVGPATMPKGRLTVDASPALSMDKTASSIKGRKVAILAGEGADGAALGSLKSGLESEGALVEVVAERGGSFTCSLGKTVEVDRAAENGPSVIYDAVVVPGGASAGELAKTGLALAFVAEAFKHGKPILALGEGAKVIEAARLRGVGPKGAHKLGVFVGDAESGVSELSAALKQHRFHNRDIAAVAVFLRTSRWSTRNHSPHERGQHPRAR